MLRNNIYGPRNKDPTEKWGERDRQHDFYKKNPGQLSFHLE